MGTGHIRLVRPSTETAVHALVAVLAVAVFITTGLAWYGFHSAESEVNKIPAAAAGTDPLPSVVDRSGTEPINILLLGSDQRPTDDVVAGQRADSIMLLHISGDRKNIHVVSIPRDSWVRIPGYGMGKINSGLAYGGVSTMVDTVESLMATSIDHVAMLDFAGTVELVDEIGGVDVYLDQLAPGDANNGLRMGMNHLSGEQALAFVRQREGLPRGDFDRMDRQHRLLNAISVKAKTSGIMRDPVAMHRLARVLVKYTTVDANLDFQRILSIMSGFSGTNKGNVSFIPAPVASQGMSPDGSQYVVQLSPRLLTELSHGLRRDELDEYPSSVGAG